MAKTIVFNNVVLFINLFLVFENSFQSAKVRKNIYNKLCVMNFFVFLLPTQKH